jgi:NAD(P)H-hydrate repair Nnr-like enzyme with NAD(P)H-hydrate dehydratase domain
VLDAGALALLAPSHPAHVARAMTPAVVLTPHAGELADLLTALGVDGADGAGVTRHEIEAMPARWARRAAEETGATVLLKGSVTVVAPPSGPLLAQADGTPWLATAGAGDVLAGLLGALLAGRADAVRVDPSLTARLAAAAALVHGRAAREASAGGPIAAGDVGRRLPLVVRQVLAGEAAE